MTKDLNDLLETIEPEKHNRIGLVVKNTGLYKYEKQIQGSGKGMDFIKLYQHIILEKMQFQE